MKFMAVGLLIALAVSAAAFAEPTRISVSVLSKGAKFVGTSLGGARVTLKDAMTGEVLAQGVTQGSTGNTDKIMVKQHKPGGPVSSEGSARFVATLEIDEPRLIEVSAYGPMAQLQATNRVSSTQWVVPGKHITGGDGWRLELPGFAVDVLVPPSHVKLSGVPQEVPLRANVTMMCGCPIEPDGLWDANRFEVKALLKQDGEFVGELPLRYAGSTSQFEATWKVETTGIYEAVVYAYDPANGNTGLDRVSFSVRE